MGGVVSRRSDALHARFLAPLEKTRGFGMTPFDKLMPLAKFTPFDKPTPLDKLTPPKQPSSGG
jgi:hypothetical protein